MKKYKVISEGIHEYDINVDDQGHQIVYSICYSLGTQWEEPFRGSYVMGLIDDGNGIRFLTLQEHIDYGALNCLRLLIELNRTNDPHADKFQIVEENLILEV